MTTDPTHESEETIAHRCQSPFERMAAQVIARPTLPATPPSAPMTDQLREALAAGRAMTSAELGAIIGRPASTVFPLLKADIARGLVVLEPAQPAIYSAVGGQSPKVRAAIELLEGLGYEIRRCTCPE